jgi:hypothetical protein
MLNKLSMGIGLVSVVAIKIIGTIALSVQPEIANTTITGIAFGAGVVLVFWGLSERRKSEGGVDGLASNERISKRHEIS